MMTESVYRVLLGSKSSVRRAAPRIARSSNQREVLSELAPLSPSASGGMRNVSYDQNLVREILWDLDSINMYLNEVRRYWACKLEVTGPQWALLMALIDLDLGGGVPVKDVAAKIHVNSSFATTQSKVLEKSGLVRRVVSKIDARVVLLSLSDRASKLISGLSQEKEAIDSFVFADFDPGSLGELSHRLVLLRGRLERAVLRMATNI